MPEQIQIQNLGDLRQLAQQVKQNSAELSVDRVSNAVGQIESLIGKLLQHQDLIAKAAGLDLDNPVTRQKLQELANLAEVAQAGFSGAGQGAVLGRLVSKDPKVATALALLGAATNSSLKANEISGEAAQEVARLEFANARELERLQFEARLRAKQQARLQRTRRSP